MPRENPSNTIRFRHIEFDALPQLTTQQGRCQWELRTYISPSTFDYDHPVVDIYVDENSYTSVYLENLDPAHTYAIFRSFTGHFIITRIETLFGTQFPPVDPLIGRTTTSAPSSTTAPIRVTPIPTTPTRPTTTARSRAPSPAPRRRQIPRGSRSRSHRRRRVDPTTTPSSSS